MTHRHLEEIDRAVAAARRAVTVGEIDRADRLTRYLYRTWYLGASALEPARPPRPRGRPRAAVPARKLPAGRTAPLVGPGPAVRRQDRAWHSWSPRWTPEHDRSGSDLVRLHLSCVPDTALHALLLVTERARSWDAPWRLSSTALHGTAATAEATVLYLPTDSLSALRAPLRSLVEELQPFLARPVPALTLKVARGAALAQNPDDGRSFGEHRCGILARSVLANQGHHHREQVHRAMLAFADAGVDPRRPYVQAPASWDREWAA